MVDNEYISTAVKSYLNTINLLDSKIRNSIQNITLTLTLKYNICFIDLLFLHTKLLHPTIFDSYVYYFYTQNYYTLQYLFHRFTISKHKTTSPYNIICFIGLLFLQTKLLHPTGTTNGCKLLKPSGNQ